MLRCIKTLNYYLNSHVICWIERREIQQTFKRQGGVVLVLVLVFMLVFGLLGMSILGKNILHMKLIGALWQKQQLRISAELGLEEAEARLRKTSPACVIPITNVAKISQQNVDWWRAISCAGNFKRFQYYYVIENLGKDNCTFVRVRDKSTKVMVAYFYRISLLALPNNYQAITNNPRVLLQSIFLKRGPPTEICKVNPHVSDEGRREWNELV